MNVLTELCHECAYRVVMNVLTVVMNVLTELS